MQKLIKQRTPLTTAQLSPNPLLNRLYQNRGIQSAQELDRSLSLLLRPQRLANIEQAVDLLIEAFQTQSRIIIVGDFDADGATSTALTLIALRQFGFKNVDYLIPDRFSQGYGLSTAVAEMVLAKGADLVMTVDNGISSFEGIALLKSLPFGVRFGYSFRHEGMLRNEQGITIRFLAFPRGGMNTQTARQMEAIWQSADRMKALEDAENGNPPKEQKTPNLVKKHYELGIKFGVTGTPYMVTETGEVIGGYVEPKQLAGMLK